MLGPWHGLSESSRLGTCQIDDPLLGVCVGLPGSSLQHEREPRSKILGLDLEQFKEPNCLPAIEEPEKDLCGFGAVQPALACQPSGAVKGIPGIDAQVSGVHPSKATARSRVQTGRGGWVVRHDERRGSRPVRMMR
jgi:hypothetical protein